MASDGTGLASPCSCGCNTRGCELCGASCVRSCAPLRLCACAGYADTNNSANSRRGVSVTQWVALRTSPSVQLPASTHTYIYHGQAHNTHAHIHGSTHTHHTQSYTYRTHTRRARLCTGGLSYTDTAFNINNRQLQNRPPSYKGPTCVREGAR